jgi:hypothetical protein
VEPARPWRIVTSQKHSTVWDGDRLLSDFNFQAMKLAPQTCFELANKRVLKPGKFIPVYMAAHWTKDKRQNGSPRQR